MNEKEENDYGPDPTEPVEKVPNNRHQRRKEAALARKDKSEWFPDNG